MNSRVIFTRKLPKDSPKQKRRKRPFLITMSLNSCIVTLRILLFPSLSNLHFRQQMNGGALLMVVIVAREQSEGSESCHLQSA